MKLIKILEEILKQLKIMNTNTEKCNHELEELKYFYDDNWHVKGSKVWTKQGKEKTLCYCKKCGRLYVDIGSNSYGK